MEVAVGLLVVIVLGYGGYSLLAARAKRRADRAARAEERARVSQADARALQRALDRRR